MTRKAKVWTALGIALVLAITAGSWGWIIHDKSVKADLLIEDAQSDVQVDAAPAAGPDEQTFSVPPIKIEYNKPAQDGAAESPAADTAQTEVERTGQNTGSVSKPEPPPPPEIPEEQKKDPTSKPEYTPEQVRPNDPDAGKDSEDKPDGGKKPGGGTDEPTGGEKKDGKIYVPGFGWIEDHGGGNDGEVADYEITGEKVGIM